MTVSVGEVPTDVPTTAPPESSPSPTTTDDLPTPAPSEETSPSPTESGIDGPTTGPLQPDASALREPLVLPDSVRQRAVDEVVPAIEDRVPDVELYLPDGPTDVPTTRLPTLSLVEAASVDDEGNPLPPAEAARRVVEVLGETRTQPLGDKVEPVGTLFSINCELRGLRGSQVLLTWEIYPREGGAPLLDGWLRRTPAYTLQPTTDHDTASVDLWVPLPKEPGTYVVRVALSVEGGGTLHSQVSEPFG